MRSHISRIGAATLALAASAVIGVAAPSTASAASCYGTGGVTLKTASYVASSGCLGQKIRAKITCAPFDATFTGNWAFYGSTTRVSCPSWATHATAASYQVAPGSA